MRVETEEEEQQQQEENEELILQFNAINFLGTPYFDHRYPFTQTDSGLGAYCHRNADILYFHLRCYRD